MTDPELALAAVGAAGGGGVGVVGLARWLVRRWERRWEAKQRGDIAARKEALDAQRQDLALMVGALRDQAASNAQLAASNGQIATEMRQIAAEMRQIALKVNALVQACERTPAAPAAPDEDLERRRRARTAPRGLRSPRAGELDE